MTCTQQGLGTVHCVCCRQNRTAGAHPSPPGILTVLCICFPMGRVERGWLEGKGGAWDKLCAYGWNGLYKETGRGSLPGLMLYRVVRYCGMGPNGGFETAAEE